MSDVRQEQARERTKQVFRYLKALHEHRSPAVRRIDGQLWHQRFSDIPQHESIEIGIFDGAEVTETDGSATEIDVFDPGFVLRVRRPKLTRAPKPPKDLEEWLEPGWEEPEQRPAHVPTINRYDEDDDDEEVVSFRDDEQRVEIFNEWVVRWEDWAAREKPARRAMGVFEELFALWGRVERESEKAELVVGDGVLRWRCEEGVIHHPVLLQRVELQFDPSGPEFTVVESDYGVELYSSLLHSNADIEGTVIATLQKELEEGGFHPLHKTGTPGFLKALAARLSPHGRYVSDPPSNPGDENPIIGRDPVLFLRARTLGFPLAIDRVLEDLEQGKPVAPSLTNVVGIDDRVDADDSSEESPLTGSSDSEENDVLLSKPANREQVEVARQLEAKHSVLVQGPPGTGKSHTIANLIGHLLAQGKKVLVTSHTTKALRVLRSHVVDTLRPLCVSVLDTDVGGREQLKTAVEAIVAGLSSKNLDTLEAEADQLASQRDQLLVKMDETMAKLVLSREHEYRPIVIGGTPIEPSAASRFVAEHSAECDWIPGPVDRGAPLPLSIDDLQELYRTNTSVSVDDETDLRESLPTPSDVPKPEEFQEMLASLTGCDSEQSDSKYWATEATTENAEELDALAREFPAVVQPLVDAPRWKAGVLTAGFYGKDASVPWRALVELIRSTVRTAVKSREPVIRYEPAFSKEIPIQERRQALQAIVAHLASRQKLGVWQTLTRPSWRRVIRGARVVGGTPANREEFGALLAAADLEWQRQELARRWNKQMAVVGAPAAADLGDDLEMACDQYATQLEECLGWYGERWLPLEARLVDFGFRWSVFLQDQPPRPERNGQLARLRDVVSGALKQQLGERIQRIWRNRADLSVQGVLTSLSTIPGPVTKRLADALATKDAHAYRTEHARLMDLYARTETLRRRRELLAKLKESAPQWAAAVQSREGVHSGSRLPDGVRGAWKWRQLQDELERRSELDEKELDGLRTRLEDDIRRVTASMIDRFAWVGQLRRTGLTERQALVGWADTVRKIGRGTGKRAPKLRAEARKRMTEARHAVPVWIMPLARVVDSFDPRTTRFDVVIIDEASQSDVMGLVAWYLADRVLVVGDHEQVSPSAVGQKLDVVQNLIGTYLEGIPNAHLYDGQTSVYDLARQSFGSTIRLVEHFRCVPDIIEFSNWLSYDGKIKPLRDPSGVELKPSVVEHYVQDARSDHKVNSMEAHNVAALLIASTQQPEYAEKSFGVVSLVGEDQAFEIEKILVRHLGVNEFERRRITCGNAAQFQGDERDVMFLSMVDGPKEGPHALRQAPNFKQRFNVAASRARDQMWLVHSLNPLTDLKRGDLRLRLIEHARDPRAHSRAVQKTIGRAQSEFEKQVLERLIAAGYRVHPQLSVGYYRIDIVVTGDGERAAIECDGDRFHPLEKIPDDMARQAVLERLKWRFIRIRGTQFFRDRDGTMESVFAALGALGVEPIGHDEESESRSSAAAAELRDRIVARAHELLRYWNVLPSMEELLVDGDRRPVA